MKKITALLLAVVLLMALCACGKTADVPKAEAALPTIPPVPTLTEAPQPTPEPAPSLAGYYKATAMTKDGEIVEDSSDADPSAYHFDIFLVLEEDGTGCMDFFGVQSPLTWDETSVTATDDESGESKTVPLIKDGDNVIIENEGEGMVFTPLTEEELADYLENGSGSLEDFFSFGEFDYPEGEPTAGTVSGKVGDAYVTILSAERFVDDDGDDAVRFWFEYRNDSDEISSAYHALFYDTWQDGEDLEYCWTYESSVPEDDYTYLSVVPGKTMRCAVTKKYDPEGGVVGFRVYDLWSSDEALFYYADPVNMPGAPADEFVIEVTGEMPDILEDLEIENDAVQLDSFEIVKDMDGNNLIRVYFVFNNNTGETTSFFMHYSVLVLQDGCELETGYPDDYVDEDTNNYEEIPDGESVDCANCYLLRSDSPIAVIITDDDTGEMIGGFADLS